MFDGKLSKITATDGDSTLEWNNAELVQITHPDSRWWFVLRELSPEELFRATTKAKLDYLALVTDTDLGIWRSTTVKKAVKKGWITPAEYEEITGESYTA